MLDDSKNSISPWDQYTPHVPDGCTIEVGSSEFEEMEAKGINELDKICFVLIAGGLGERLGYSQIKISLPISIIPDDYSYLRYYCKYVQAFQDRAR